jgi:hypothetical protein
MANPYGYLPRTKPDDISANASRWDTGKRHRRLYTRRGLVYTPTESGSIMPKINGIAAASIGTGFIFAFAGIKGYSIPQTLQTLISGKNPQNQSQVTPITGGGTFSSPITGSLPPGGTDTQNQALGKLMAGAYGWGTGQEWSDLNSLVMGESGWSSTVENPDSGAAGIAQKISGWSADYQKGNARQQITWLLNYIKGRYGTPSAAYAFWLAQSPHWY